jgi:bacterioferritin
MNAPDLRPEGKPALPDKKTLRESARRHVEDGAVTEHYRADRAKVIELLNEALATELVCTLRYRHDYYMAQGLKAKIAAAEFLEHAGEELDHAGRLAERIVQLGGEPDFNPQNITGRSHAEYRLGRTLDEMIKENLVAERIAIERYRAMARFVGEDDSTTRRLLESILEVEEEHADDLADLLHAMPGG